MSVLATFFNGTDTHLGLFYPTRYLFAVYPSFENAEEARNQLAAAGLGSERTIAVPGEDVIQFAEEHVSQDGIWGALMREISRLLATEEVYAEHDLKLARRGAGFLAVHCQNDHAKERVWSHLEPTRPVVARYYMPSGIEHLKGEV
jgi:hypothetical protein